jgi:hypothetical protein
VEVETNMGSNGQKGISSYDKIARHLFTTPDFQDFIKITRKRLEDAGVLGWRFQADNDEPTELPRVYIQFSFGDLDTQKERARPETSEPTGYETQDWHFTLEDELKKIVDRNFGTKTCPSYFCKKETVTDGTKQIPSFVSKARDFLRKELSVEIAAANSRLRAEALATMESPECGAARQAFFDRTIIDDIKLVLLKWKDVATAPVLKQALDEYVAHEIMES